MTVWNMMLIGAVAVVMVGCAPHSKLGDREESTSRIDHPKRYVCCRAAGPVVIDGRIDEPAWADAPWTDFFVDIEGGIKPRPRFTTRARMLWDEAYFYIAAELEEPHVWGTLKDRDQIVFYDNDFEVFISPGQGWRIENSGLTSTIASAILLGLDRNLAKC